jgi:hypothetical protein
MKSIAWKPVLEFALALILKYVKLLAVSAAIVIALAVTALVFYRRPPVLIVTDAPFIELYGKGRLRRQGLEASFALLRRVKPVIVADGVSPDIVTEAIAGASPRPFPATPVLTFSRRRKRPAVWKKKPLGSALILSIVAGKAQACYTI